MRQARLSQEFISAKNSCRQASSGLDIEHQANYSITVCVMLSLNGIEVTANAKSAIACVISTATTDYLTTPSRAIPMPAYYEMLVSQSPPLFSHSPPTGFLSEYGPNRFYESPRFCRSAAVLTPPSARRFPPQMQQPSLYQTHLQSLTPYRPSTVPKPKRSCLIVRNEDPIKSETTSESSDDSDDGEKIIRSKKRVVFADDKGLELEHVKIMSEPSTQPPTWSLQFLAHVTQGMISPVPQEQWTIDFRQPASDYLEFRRKLEASNVSLENVIIKESESTVVGTVKVKNLSFHKEVFIRSSWDSWKSQTDTFCTFSQIVGASGAYVIYDTFSFKLTLPPHSRNLEFCVCYRTDLTEYWDSNGGQNYKLTNRVSAQQQENELVLQLNNTNINGTNQRKLSNPIDMTKQKISSWSEFSSRQTEPLPYCSSSTSNGVCNGLYIY